MLKRLLLSGTALVALTTMAMAQAATPPGPAPSRPGMTTSAPATTGAVPSQNQNQTKNQPLFTNYKGADVLGSDGKSIGAVADVIIDSQGDVKQLILSHGGVIGIGSTLNAYDVQKLPMLNDGKVKLGLTTASLDQLPKFEYPSGNGNAPAEGRASTSTAPRTMSAPPANSAAPSPTTTGSADAAKPDQSAMNSAAANAASTAAATSASGSMWPVSYLVGADIKKGDKSAAISDARFEGGKLSAVIVNDGTDLGLGKGKQQIAFNELSISGTPKKPEITLSGSGSMGASTPSSGTSSNDNMKVQPNPPATNPPSSSGSMSK